MLKLHVQGRNVCNPPWNVFSSNGIEAVVQLGFGELQHHKNTEYVRPTSFSVITDAAWLTVERQHGLQITSDQCLVLVRYFTTVCSAESKRYNIQMFYVHRKANGSQFNRQKPLLWTKLRLLRQVVKEFWWKVALPLHLVTRMTVSPFWNCTFAAMHCPLQTSFQTCDAAAFAAYAVQCISRWGKNFQTAPSHGGRGIPGRT